MLGVTVVSIADVPEVELSRRDMVKSQGTRHLVGPAGVPTSSFAADWVQLPGGFVHMMHRHPMAEQVMVPLDGVFLVAEPGFQHRVAPGQLVVIARGSWHEVRNESLRVARALVLFTGVGSAVEAGYEEFDPQSLDGAGGWVPVGPPCGT